MRFARSIRPPDPDCKHPVTGSERSCNIVLPACELVLCGIDAVPRIGYHGGMKRQILTTAPLSLSVRRLLRLLFALLLIGAASVLCISAYVKAAAEPHLLSQAEAADFDADCILVLGAGLRGNGQPSTILADRLDLAIELYQSGASDRLLMSGDHSRKDYDEVSAMRNYAADRQVALSHIFLDHAGFSTYESLYRARDIFGAERILIVTQRYHLYRALYIADALGLEARGVAADARTYARQPYYTLREIAARSKDFLYTIVQPAPTYLGDVIPLSGDGRVTGQLSWHPLV